jgi:hypothetical protein
MDFLILIHRFLYEQLQSGSNSDSLLSSSNISLDNLPKFHGQVAVYNSTVAKFYVTSDLSGVGGMHRECILAVQSWKKGPPRYDCIFTSMNPTIESMRDLDIGRVQLFFKFDFHGVTYPCALIQWFSRIGDNPDEDTGMWMVKPEVDDSDSPIWFIIHLDSMMHAAHLIGVYGDGR